MYAAGVEEVKALLLARANELANRRPEDRRRSSVFERSHKIASDLKNDVCFGKGLYQDLRNRLPHYWSDYSEGLKIDRVGGPFGRVQATTGNELIGLDDLH
ncbi:hypothetical protein X801_07755, partial [Opisthorchis viverrini]